MVEQQEEGPGRDGGAALGSGRGRRAQPVRPSSGWRSMRRVTERPRRLAWLFERDR